MSSGSDQSSDFVLASKEAGVAVLQLNRPLKRNALSQDLIRELTGAMQQLDRDIDVRCVILTSAGQSPFCGE
jgi:enoyl-CoA hydratase